MKKETLRMQMLAGIITESQYKEKIQENKVEGIDVSQVKDLMSDPNVKKMAAQLKSDPKSLKNAIKFIADHSKDNTSLDEEQSLEEGSLKDRINSILLGSGIAAPIGWLFGFMADSQSVDASLHGLATALTAAIMIGGMVALGTTHDKTPQNPTKQDMNEVEISVEDQIQKIIDLGKSM
jgi:hypothetical protein